MQYDKTSRRSALQKFSQNLFKLPLHSLKCHCLAEPGSWQQIIFFLESNQSTETLILLINVLIILKSPYMWGKADEWCLTHHYSSYLQFGSELKDRNDLSSAVLLMENTLKYIACNSWLMLK